MYSEEEVDTIAALEYDKGMDKGHEDGFEEGYQQGVNDVLKQVSGCLSKEIIDYLREEMLNGGK